ncbi:MAG: hypothetical protein IT580_05355 [Verrucomicrobiales bacterium]|nr:hypothetical protein [Verrucomicrobiales bacterium]
MKTKLALALAFVCGALFATMLVALALVHWNGQQSQAFWSSYLHNYANDALRLSRGQQEEVLRNMESKLPGVVRSVHSFGENETTRGALHRAKEFYAESGKPVPQEIAGIISSPHF